MTTPTPSEARPSPCAPGTADGVPACPAPSAGIFTAIGKQVLHGASHYADARDPEAAVAIAAGLNTIPVLCDACRKALCGCSDAAWAEAAR